MGPSVGDPGPLWPLAVYFAAVLLVAGGMIGTAYLLGEHHRERSTGERYESGMATTDVERAPHSIEFYQMAMFFVIFDIEAVFIFAWAVALRDVGWTGYVEIVIFIAVLVAALLYLWRLGSLDWGAIKRGRRGVR